MKILFVVDAGPAVGLGHLVRSITLAKELKGCQPVFCLPEMCDQASCQRIEREGWEWFFGYEHMSGFSAVIFDLECGAPPEGLIEIVGKQAVKIGFVGAGYKNIGYEKLDLSIVQGIPNPKPPDNGKCFHGPEYVVLRESFKQEPTFDRDPSIVFVCGGGSDPLDFTYLAVQALEKCERVKEIHIVLGSLYRGRLMFDQMYGEDYVVLYPHEFVRVIHRDVENPYEIMSKCGLALVSFGMTAYECMAAGLPTLTLSMSEDHLASAEALAKLNAVMNLGLIQSHDAPSTITSLSNLIWRLLPQAHVVKFLATNGRKLVDGRGAERVAAKILEIL